jgi:hypothetical protein
MWDMEWQSLRQKVRDYRRLLRRRGFGWEIAWTVEKGKNGNLHVNALQKGDYVPQRVLQDVWGGIVHVQKIGRNPERVAGYATKEARRVAGYTVKEAGRAREAHLVLNGGRLVHLSRDYLGGETKVSVLQSLRATASHGDTEWQRVDGARPPGKSGAALARAALVPPS